MWSVDRREIGDCVSEVEELIGKRQELSEARVFVDWTGQKSEAKSSRMSPSELSWLQGCLFLFLGLAGGYGLNRCQNRRTNHGTSDVELGRTTPPPSDDADSSGGDEEARSPWNLSNPFGEAMAFTGSPRCPDRNRLRSKSRRPSRGRMQPSAETRKKSHFLEFVATTAAPNFVRRETADRTSSPMSSPTEGLLRLSGGEDEALSPSSGGNEEARSPWNLSNPVGEAMASTGSPRCPDRNRLRSKSRRRSRRRLQPPAKIRKKSHLFVAATAAPNFVRRETADRTSSPMSSPTEGLLRLSGGEDEALSPSHPVREVLASLGAPSCPDRKRYRPDSCRRMNAPEKRTKSPFMAQDEAENVGSSSTSMASKTAVLRRPPRRQFVARPPLEIPLVDHVQAGTSDGLRFRPRGSQKPSGESERDIFKRLDNWAHLGDESGVPKVNRRAVKDSRGSVTHYKYEPRFKPRREKLESGGSLRFSYLPLGLYDTRREAEIVRHIAVVLYGKEEGRPVQFEDGLCLPFPSVTNHEKCPPCGKEKAVWVARKTKELYAKLVKQKANRLQRLHQLLTLPALLLR